MRWSWNWSNTYPKKFHISFREPNNVTPVSLAGSRVKWNSASTLGLIRLSKSIPANVPPFQTSHRQSSGVVISHMAFARASSGVAPAANQLVLSTMCVSKRLTRAGSPRMGSKGMAKRLPPAMGPLTLAVG